MLELLGLIAVVVAIFAVKKFIKNDVEDDSKL